MDIPKAESTELSPCSICGRTFRPETLERHQNICKKSSEKKRRVFDSKKQRFPVSNDTNNNNNSVEVSILPKKETKPKERTKPRTNWREKHENVIQTVKKTRDNDGTKAEESIKSRIPSDYVQCPGCQRHFNQRAAERHIPWCEQKQQNRKPQPTEDAREKLIARVKYRAPLPKKIKKPKTANYEKKTRHHQSKEREQGSYSSPPTFFDNRNHHISSRESNRLRNESLGRKGESRQRSQSKESKLSTSPDVLQQTIKFKEKFPNRKKKRDFEIEDSFTAEHLQELLRASHLADRCPKTVPGLRLLETSGRQNWTSGWNNKQLLDDSVLPEVSSSEIPDTWIGKVVWGRDMETSGSSSGSSSSGSLPSTSRESPSDNPVRFHCHQCHHKFPLVGAKYCCECGARRRVGTISQTL